MGDRVGVLLRVLPWLMTTLSANLIHYSSLWMARYDAHQQFRAGAVEKRKERWYPGSDPDEHDQLSFNLMDSPMMKKARYMVKLVRYSCTLFYVALFYRYLPELSWEKFSPGLSTVEAVIVGGLSGLVTLYLDENSRCEIRTCWYPGVDYGSPLLGHVWDAVRVTGAVATPVEDELIYHSWMYRSLSLYLSPGDDAKPPVNSFTQVPFMTWNSIAFLACNAAFAVYNGKEWRSCGAGGVAFALGHLQEGPVFGTEFSRIASAESLSMSGFYPQASGNFGKTIWLTNGFIDQLVVGRYWLPCIICIGPSCHERTNLNFV